jgi:thiamine transporter ThiT
MLFIVLIGWFYGLGSGLACAIAYGLLQLLIDPYILSLPQLLTDYILAFGALGLSGIFADKKHGLVKGYITGVLGRLFFLLPLRRYLFRNIRAEICQILRREAAAQSLFIFLPL